MAKRFGGRFSPGGSGTGRSAQGSLGRNQGMGPIRHRLASRPKYVTLAAVPLLFSAFFQDPVGMATSLAGFGTIASAMWMTREGLAAEAAYEIRQIARRPAIPRKLFGSVMTGLGLGLASVDPGNLAGAAVIGATGMALHWLAFGADPMRDKGIATGGDFQHDRAQKMIEEGEGHLDQMRDAIVRTNDRWLESRVERFADTATALFDRVRSNPGDLSGTRRYMGVYLMGARDATVKFAALYRQTQDAAVRQSYETFLDDLENDFNAKSRRLLEGDRSGLDIEISVLRDRLAQEGVRPADQPEISDHAAPGLPRSESARFMDQLLTQDRDKVR